jgi:hypothetical protein
VQTLKKYSSDVARRIFIVNKAQAQKWLGDVDACLSTLNAEDWSACDDKFQIALAVLRDDFDRAIGLMRRMGREGQIRKSAYRSWPIFQKFRQRQDFRDGYLEVFGEGFDTVQTEAARPAILTDEPLTDKPN